MRTPATSLDLIQRTLPWTDRNARSAGAEHAHSDPSEGEVARVHEAYRLSGGLVTGGDVLAMLRLLSDQPLSILARRIVDRSVVHFAWRAQTFFPLAQFDDHTMQVRSAWSGTLRCLRDHFDDWGVARWFATPTALLEGSIPADAIRHDPHGVAEVARLAVRRTQTI